MARWPRIPTLGISSRVKRRSADVSHVEAFELGRQQERLVLVARVGQQIRHVAQRIDLVQLAAFDQAVVDRRGLAAALGADEQKILSSKGYRSHAALGVIVVRFQMPVFGIVPPSSAGCS